MVCRMTRFIPSFLSLIVLIGTTQAALAQSPVPIQQDKKFIHNGTTTHDAINLTMDKSELIRLDQDAASIVVGNPSHVNVLAENPRLLVVVPIAPGATHISVLGPRGDVVMQRHVIVAAPNQNYMRIRKSCAKMNSDDCVRTQTYYCPGMCHEIAPLDAGGSSDSQSDDQAMAAARSGADVGSADE